MDASGGGGIGDLLGGGGGGGSPQGFGGDTGGFPGGGAFPGDTGGFPGGDPSQPGFTPSSDTGMGGGPFGGAPFGSGSSPGGSSDPAAIAPQAMTQGTQGDTSPGAGTQSGTPSQSQRSAPQQTQQPPGDSHFESELQKIANLLLGRGPDQEAGLGQFAEASTGTMTDAGPIMIPPQAGTSGPPNVVTGPSFGEAKPPMGGGPMAGTGAMPQPQPPGQGGGPQAGTGDMPQPPTDASTSGDIPLPQPRPAAAGPGDTSSTTTTAASDTTDPAGTTPGQQGGQRGGQQPFNPLQNFAQAIAKFLHGDIAGGLGSLLGLSQQAGQMQGGIPEGKPGDPWYGKPIDPRYKGPGSQPASPPAPVSPQSGPASGQNKDINEPGISDAEKQKRIRARDLGQPGTYVQDKNGKQVLTQTGPDGKPMFDANGEPVPVQAQTGGAGGPGTPTTRGSYPPLASRAANRGVALGPVHPALQDTLAAGAHQFETNNPGYKVQVNSGHRGGNDPHGRNNAVDLQIVGPNGPIANAGADTTGKYTELARTMLGAQKALHPELNGRLAWGGYFNANGGHGFADPRTGANRPDLMHFDLEGNRPWRTAMRDRFNSLGATGNYGQGGAASTQAPQPLPAGTSRPPGDIPYPGNTIKHNVANALASGGAKPNAIAGIMSNIGSESGWNMRSTGPAREQGLVQFSPTGDELRAYNQWRIRNGNAQNTPENQMKFLANRLQTAYPQTWAKMNAARTPAEAAETFTREYERPAARYLNQRVNKIRSQGVPSVEQQLGPRVEGAPNAQPTQLAMRGDVMSDAPFQVADASGSPPGPLNPTPYSDVPSAAPPTSSRTAPSPAPPLPIEPGEGTRLPEIRVDAPGRHSEKGPTGDVGKLPRKEAGPTSDIGKLPKKKTKPKGMPPKMKKQIQARQQRLVEIPGTPTGMGRGTTSYYVDQ